MKRNRKIAAAALAALMAAGLCACGENATWAAKYGDTTVPAGVYIINLISQYDEWIVQVPADAKEPFAYEVDGVPVGQRMQEGARQGLENFIAIEQQFESMGLELQPADEQAVSVTMEMWNYMEPVYELNGVSQQSYEMVATNSAKQQRIFESIYGAGGSEEVPESELRAAFEENYAKVLMIPLTLSTSQDPEIKAEADATTRETMADFYAQLENGADMEDVYYEARKLATGDDELERPEPGTSYTFINKQNTSYDQVLVDAVFAAQVGEPVQVETDGGLYLFERYDLNENPQDFADRAESLLMELKRDEFLERVAGWADALTGVTYNQEALGRYTPEKIRFN